MKHNFVSTWLRNSSRRWKSRRRSINRGGGCTNWSSLYFVFHSTAEPARKRQRGAGAEKDISVIESKAFFCKAIEARVSCRNKCIDKLWHSFSLTYDQSTFIIIYRLKDSRFTHVIHLASSTWPMSESSGLRACESVGAARIPPRRNI